MLRNEFIKTVEALTGCELITLVWEKVCGMRKSYDGPSVIKRTEMQGRVGAEYVNSVNNRVKAETGEAGTFEPLPLPWGEWSVYPRTIEHKGAKYVRLTRWEEQDNLKPARTVWICQGEEYERFEDLPADARANMLASDKPKARVENKRQADAGAEENQVKAFTVNSENVKIFRASGGEWPVTAG